MLTTRECVGFSASLVYRYCSHSLLNLSLYVISLAQNNLRIFKDGALIYGGRPTAKPTEGAGAYAAADALTLEALNGSLYDFAISSNSGEDGLSPGQRVMVLVQQLLKETGKFHCQMRAISEVFPKKNS